MNQPKIDRRVDLPSLHLRFNFGESILSNFPQEFHLFVGVFSDTARKCVSKELHEEVDELVLVPMGKLGPGGSQYTSRHFLVIHTMFDDFFDFMPPFFGLFRLLQGFVIKDWIRSLIVLLTASVALDVVPICVVVASEGDATVSPATIAERNNKSASLLIFLFTMGITVHGPRH